MAENIFLPKIGINLLYTEENEFEEHILTLLRVKDDIGLKQIGFIAEEEISSRWEETKGKTISEVRDILNKHVQGPLDKLLILCSLLIQYDNISPLTSLVSNFYNLYSLGGKGELGFSDSEKEHLSSSVIWEEVITRVYILGALAILFEKFKVVPILITKPWAKEHPGDIQKHRFWARHAFHMLVQEGRLQHPSLCLLAEEKIKQNEWFLNKFKRYLDLFRNVTCQFDFLQCVCALSNGGTFNDVFPSFGIFNKSRTEPIVLDLVLKGKSRESIPDLTDSELAKIISSLDGFAAEKFSGNGWNQNSWMSKEIREFLKKNAS